MTTPPGYAPDGPLISTWPRVLVQIAWNAGGNSTSPNHWYTVSSRLRGKWKATLAGRQYEMDAIQAGTFTFALDNVDGAFDPDNTASVFYPNVVPYRRCRLVLMANPSQNLLYPWVAAGTSTLSMSSTVGTISTATGLAASGSGLTTAQTWTIPNGSGSGVAFGLTGDAGGNWTTTDSDGTTAAPGLPYAAGIDVCLAAGGMTSLPLKARIAFYSMSGTMISRTLGTVQSVTTSWTRLTVAATAPSNAAWALVSLSTNVATTAATTVQTTGWQLEQASAATAWASPGTWAQMWQGFVERWPQKYEKGGKYGLVDVTAVDPLAPLSQLTLRSAMATAVAQSSPAYTFDLASPAPASHVSGSAFYDLGGTGAELDITGSAISTGVSITSTSPLGTLWNVNGPVVTLSNNQASSLGNAAGATYLAPWTGSNNVMLPASGWTRMICFRTTLLPGAGSRFTQATLWSATAAGFQSGSGDQSGAQVAVYSNGYVVAKVQNSAGTNQYFFNSVVPVTDGDWHCAILTLSADGKTARLIVDNSVYTVTSGSSLGSSTYTTEAIGTLLTTNGSGENTQPFNGDIAWFAQWNTELSVSAAADIANGFANGWSGDAVSTRINRILTLSGFHPGSQFAGGVYKGSSGTLGGISLTGRAALDPIQEAADTENGQFATDRFGTSTLYGHLWRWVQNTPIVTFGENVPGGEVPYQDDIAFEQDPAHLYNDVQITVDGASDLTNANGVQEVSDTTSQNAYFPQTLTRTVNPLKVQQAKDMAAYLLSQFKDPHTRLQGLTVDCASSPGRLAAVVGLNVSDLVQVNRRPTLAPAKSLQCFIEQIEWSGDDTGAQLQAHFQMSPVSQYRYWMISATWAALTAGIAAGVGVITVGPVSGNNAIAAQYVIPAGWQMTLGYGTPNAETVTVQSVQTVSAGYSTVQLTLTANTVNSHSAGDLICDPLPNGATIPPAGPAYPKCYDTASAIGGTQPLIGF